MLIKQYFGVSRGIILFAQFSSCKNVVEIINYLFIWTHHWKGFNFFWYLSHHSFPDMVRQLLGQGCLNKKEIQLNLCSVFSISIFNEFKTRARSYFYQIPCKRSLFHICSKNFNWNKIMFPASNSLDFAELVVNEPMKSIYKKIYQNPFLY